MAFTSKNLFAIIFALAVLAVLVFLAPGGFSPADKPQNFGGKVSPLAALPEGRQEFTIASTEGARPRFVSAVIDPLKVSIGDTQKMKVVLHDEAEVVSVVAEIETDSGMVNVPLRLVERTAVTRGELDGQKYVIKDGLLTINDGAKQTSSGLLDAEVAQAVSLQKFTFEGEWVVRDTSVKTYRTKFKARDAIGRENSVTMAWSDPCSGITHGSDSSLLASCSINGITDGIDGGNLTISIATTTLTISNSGIFVYNPGKSITLQQGSIAINTGGQLKQAYLCSRDQDKDGYVDGGSYSASDFSNCSDISGGIRLASTTAGNLDCYFELPTSTTRAHLVNPGQTSFFTTARGDGSFDYDCDGIASQERTAVLGEGNPGALNPCEGLSLSACTGTGWIGTVAPECGQSSAWTQGDCLWNAIDGFCEGSAADVAQTCR